MKEKLLALDDEQLILASLRHLFEDEYEVFTTSSAAEALQMAQEHHDMAVILCDERMPGVSGHEFLRRVREISKATRVMMSGYADVSALTDAVNNGQIFAYIPKPWEPLQLKAQVAVAVVHYKLVHEIEQERTLLRALMENIPDLIYFKDRESRFTRVNQAHAINLGAKDPTECIGKSNADYFEPADALRWRFQEEEIVSSGQPMVDTIEQLKHPRGGFNWWSTTKVPMFDRGGQVSGIAGISRNITALKNTEEMLREQSEHNRLILETAHDAFIGMDPDGTITSWNPQAEVTFGWAAVEVIGRRWSDTVIAPKGREAHAHGVSHFLAEAQGSVLNQAIELVALHRDNHEFPVEATIWPVRAGGVCSFNAFVRDISERRRAEEARRKEAALVQLLQSVTVAANESSTIEYAAQVCLNQICSYTGWPVGHVCLRANDLNEDLISSELWHLEEAGRFASFSEASDHLAPGRTLAAESPTSDQPQWIVNLPDSKLAPERIREAERAGLRSGFAFPVVIEEKAIGVFEFFSLQTIQPDEEFLVVMKSIGSQLGQVIMREHAEKRLQRAKAAAESANSAKSEFLTTMSHEMRTPMNAMLGMADLLSEGTLGDEQRDYVRVFQKAGASLLDLINDLLDLSKVESGQFKLESIGFDLGALLEKIIEMMASPAQDRGLRLSLEILPGVPLHLIGDPNRLRQIILNLIGNAVKFTERGSVKLLVEVDLVEAAGWLRFSVVDTGIGIAADKTGMIFDRFTQADSSTTRKYGGTGLGLAISRGLVELMGGRIACTSELGKGSTFFITAPFEVGPQSGAESAEPAQITVPSSGPAGSRPVTRILIVEDSEYNVLLIKAYLKNNGFELDFAENGKIAVEKVMSGHFQIVLMDLQMPVMGGLEATRAIRQWEAKNNLLPVPILALTAHAAEEAVGRSLEAGCTEHLTKPIKRAVLLASISKHTGGKIRITPPKDIETLVPNYLAKIRREMDEILAGSESNDHEVARRLGHQFKGSGEGYGFPEITRTGAAVETAAISADETEIRSQILALASYLDQVEIVVSLS